jgi:short-subunit dehydrogenase
MNTTKKYVVITGASAGIGYETAKAFASRNKNLIVVARRYDKLQELSQEILQKNPKLDIVTIEKDLSITENAHQLYQELKKYQIEAWINNAGFGNYGSIAEQDLAKTEAMLRLNIETLVILSSMYVRDYKDVEGAQLINLSSAGGYSLAAKKILYCATKFFVSAFTEGLAQELKESGAKMQAKVLAPAATKTEFGKIANHVSEFDYDKSFGFYHTAQQMAEFLLKLYDSDKIVSKVKRGSLEFKLSDTIFPYAGDTKNNKK